MAGVVIKKEREKNAILKAKNSCFKKRKESVIRKTMQLSVLCDIKACVVVMEPNGRLETWPENPDSVREIITMYRDFITNNGCKKKRVSEKSVKVEMGSDNVPEIVKIHEESGAKKGGRKQREEEVVSVDDFLREIDSKIETFEERTDLSNEIKGKEVSVLSGEQSEFDDEFLTDLWNQEEEETTDSQAKYVPHLAAVSEENIPCFRTMPGQNLSETPQIFNYLDNSSGTGDHQNVQIIPEQYNFNFNSNNSTENIQVPNQDQPLWIENNTFNSRMLDRVPPGLYPEFQDCCLNFSGGAFMMQPDVITPCWFGGLPQLYPLPLQPFQPYYYSSQQQLFCDPSSSSSSLQHQNMQYQGL